MPAGRPSEYNYELCKEICEHIANGMGIIKALEQSDSYPSWTTFRRWKSENVELQTLYYTVCSTDKHKQAVKCKSNPKGSRATNRNDYRVRNAREQNKKKYPQSDIYIFKMGELGVYKIGVSQNVERRLRDINSANPFSVVLLFSLSVKDAYDLEDTIHSQYNYAALQNEWFALSETDLSEIIQTIKSWQKQPLGIACQFTLAI